MSIPAIVLAGGAADVRCALQERLASPSLRIYTNEDLIGVESAAALKNIRAMKVGDRALVYHTGKEKAVVGRAEIVTAVESAVRIIFWASPPFMRVEPVTTSGPTCGAIEISTDSASGEPASQVIAIVRAPSLLAASIAPST